MVFRKPLWIWFWSNHCKFSMVFEETITIEYFSAVWPLLSMVFQWFLILLPSLSMVFDGSVPLIKRCDGFDGSLWSNLDLIRSQQSWGSDQGSIGCGPQRRVITWRVRVFRDPMRITFMWFTANIYTLWKSAVNLIFFFRRMMLAVNVGWLDLSEYQSF